jgi:hypothetical protein
VNDGLCLPRKMFATLDANLPKVCPSASITYQFLVVLALLAEIVL